MTASDGGDIEVTPGNPAGYFTQYAKEGLSSNEALRQFRAAGGRIGNERGRVLYSQVRDALARAPDVMSLDPFQLPSAGDYSTWAMGRGGQYATQVNVLVIDRQTGMAILKDHTYVTNDPHIPNDATDDAAEVFGDADVQSDYGETYIASWVTNIYKTVPYDA